MLSEYTPTCGYNQASLDNEIIVFGHNAVKNIKIDDGEAYVDSISGYFRRIECRNVELDETQTLNGRYVFSKTVNFTVNGYWGQDLLNDMRYVIIRTKDGAYRLVTVDFPAEMSYEFTLEDDAYQTEYTLHTYSNFPSLRISGDFGSLERICTYGVAGIDKVMMNLRDSVLLDRTNAKLITNSDRFCEVEYLSASVSEAYSDTSDSAVTNLTVTIPLSDYESSWHYNVSEFNANRFSFIISPLSSSQRLFLGFDKGMMPLYHETASEDSSYITVTFTETGNVGICALYDYEEEVRSEIAYQNVARVGKVETFECAGEGIGQYLVQKEVDGLGNPTGNYLAYTGYESYFSDLGINITGTFNTYHTFATNRCLWNTCSIDTNIPTTLNFFGTGTTDTYVLKSNCDWSIDGLPSQITGSVTEGTADTYYSISFTNASSSEYRGTFTINSGASSRVVNVIVGKRQFMYPSAVTTDCLQKDIPIVSDSSCSDISVIPNYLNVRRVASGYFIVSVPENMTETGRTMSLTFTNNCSGRQQIVNIDQDKRYVEWIRTDRYICEDGYKYFIEQQYSGATPQTIAETPITRRGSVVSGVTECSVEETDYYFDGYYICLDTNQFELLAERTRMTGGSGWTYTGRYILGDMTDGSQDCSHALVLMTGDSYYYFMDGENTVNRSDISRMTEDTSTIYYAIIGDNVTNLGYRAFYDCNNLTDITFGSGVTTIGEQAFRDCYSLVSVSVPASVRNLGEGAFSGCTGAESLTIGASVNTIPERCFEGMTGIEHTEMPYNVTQIGNYAFAGCENLALRMVRPQPPVLDLGDDSVYHHFDMVQAIEIPSSSMHLYSTADGWSLWQSKFIPY